MSTVQQPLLTIEDFMKLPDPPDGSRMELVRGELVIMPPPKARHGVCCSRIDRLIGNYVDTHKLGWMATNDTGVVLERAPDTVRGPDVAFWSIKRQPAMPEDYFEIPPDLAIEVLSPHDRRKDVLAKIKEYRFYGVPLIWLVDPETRTVMVYKNGKSGVETDEEEVLDGGDILPGFTCKVADLFG